VHGGPVQQPYAGIDFIPQSGIYEFGYSMTAGQEDFNPAMVTELESFFHERKTAKRKLPLNEEGKKRV
jgi:hypothetical protein